MERLRLHPMDLRLPPGLLDGPGPRTGAAEHFVLHLLKAALGQSDLAVSATAVAQEMAREWACDRVFIAVVERRFARVLAVSGAGQLSGARPLLGDIASAMDETLDQGAVVTCPPHPEGHPRVTRAHGQLIHRHGLGALVTVPLFVDMQPVGAVMFERRSGPALDASWVQRVQPACEALAPLLQLQLDREQNPWTRSLRRASARWQALPTTRRRVWLAAVPFFVAAIAGAMSLPLTHQVAASGTLQGRVQRAVVAPLDGYLKAVHVRAGDSIQAGELLAELVDDDLRLEQRRRQTEVAQHETTYGDAMARQDRATLVLAEARAAEARAQLGLVEAQLARTRLLAPFDGLVIAGDLQQQLAAPLRKGELLFTLTPTRELRLLLQVDERDSTHVQPGQRGEVTFSALPAKRFEVVVERLSPLAQTQDGRNVFEAEARLLVPPQDALRPGMQGLAQLQAGQQALGWLLTHHLTDWVRLQWWRWVA